MATTEITDITDLVRRGRAAIDDIVRTGPLAPAPGGRTCIDFALELREAIERVHDTVAETEAFIDIASTEPLSDELQDVAARGAAALFLGRRLFEVNAVQIVQLHRASSRTITPLIEIAELLGTLSNEVLQVFDVGLPAQRGAA